MRYVDGPGRLGRRAPMEIPSAGRCLGVDHGALVANERAIVRALRTGAHERVVVVGSELCRASLPCPCPCPGLGARGSAGQLDGEFLRRTLGRDVTGRAVVVLEIPMTRLRPDGTSVRLDWIRGSAVRGCCC